MKNDTLTIGQPFLNEARTVAVNDPRFASALEIANALKGRGMLRSGSMLDAASTIASKMKMPVVQPNCDEFLKIKRAQIAIQNQNAHTLRMKEVNKANELIERDRVAKEKSRLRELMIEENGRFLTIFLDEAKLRMDKDAYLAAVDAAQMRVRANTQDQSNLTNETK